MKFVKSLWIITVTVCLLSACVSNDPHLAAPTKKIVNKNELNCNIVVKQPEQVMLSDDQRAKFLKLIPLADMAAQRGQFGPAISNYLLAAQLSKDPNLTTKALYYAEKTGDYISSLEAADLWVELDPTNMTARRFQAVGYLRSNRDLALQKTLKNMLCLSLDLPKGRLLEALNHIKQSYRENAVSVQFKVFSQKYPQNSEILLALAKSLEMDGDIAQALKKADLAVKIDPDYDAAQEIKGLILTRSGAINEAEAFFKQATINNPEVDSFRLHWAQLLYQKGEYQAAVDAVLPLSRSETTSNDANFLLGSGLYALKKYNESEQVFLLLLQTGYRKDSLNYFLGEINRHQSHPLIAVQFFDAVNSGSYVLRARIAAADILANEQQLHQARNRLKSMPKAGFSDKILLANKDISLLKESNTLATERPEISLEFKKNPTDIFFFSRALLAATDQKERLKVIDKALNEVSSETSQREVIIAGSELLNRVGDPDSSITLLNDFLEGNPQDLDLIYSRSMIKAQVGDMAGMEQDLRKILEIDKEHTDALNALGYSLADQNIDLDNAFQMIMKAYNKRPNSAAIADSLGWVLYRQGQLEQAIYHLKQAWKLAPSAEIGAHLGEVLWTSNDKFNALKIWEMATKINAENSTLIETQARLKGSSD